MKLLCSMGIHKYGKPKFIYAAGSNIKDYKQVCLRCEKIKKFVKIVKNDY